MWTPLKGCDSAHEKVFRQWMFLPVYLLEGAASNTLREAESQDGRCEVPELPVEAGILGSRGCYLMLELANAHLLKAWSSGGTVRRWWNL
jgi:hypothetical protein